MLLKHSWFYKAIDSAINAFGERHNLTARQHLAPMLGYNGDNASIMLGTALNCTTYNPINPKPLTIDQVAVLLEELGADRKPILDAIAKKCDGIFVSNCDVQKKEPDSVKDELLMIAGFAGNLSSKFLEYKNNDGLIDEDEANELEHIAFETRQHLQVFEEMIAKSKAIMEE